MARWKTKHPERQQVFKFKSFTEGLITDVSPMMIPTTALSRCRNMKYAISKEEDGSSRIVLKLRQGTTVISNTALPSSADVLACTYYVAHSKYILATASKLYYLDGSLDPVEIGTSVLSGIPTFTEFNGKLIIHDGGITKCLHDTTLTTLNELVDDEIIGTGNNSDVDFSGTLDYVSVEASTLTIVYTDGTQKTITSNAAGTLGGDVATHELMPNQVDRDFSGASAWAQATMNAYNETDDLTITASAAGQYCTLEVASAPTTAGKRYRMTFSVASLTATWTIKSYDGTQTIGTVTTAGAQTFDWTATTTGGYRIVAVANNSAGTFDDFTLTTNVIDYNTGVYSFRASGAPDTSTSLYATYEHVDGAPKSTAGTVRGNCLYMWGDSDNPSRIWYSGPNDEEAWDNSTNGGYVDVDKDDGYSLVGALNYFATMLLIKGNSLHRMDNFPGDTTFQVVPVMSDIGSVSGKTCLNDGEIISFLSKEGLVGMASTQRYGDIQKTADLSKAFRNYAVQYANSSGYSDYNQLDKQLWLALYDGSTYLPDIYVINMATGGQLSLYKFAFGHSCFKYVNGMMLIGGVDGKLYKLVDDDSTFLDNAVSYSSSSSFRSSFTDWGLPFQRKHNKKLICNAYGKGGITANLKLFKDQAYLEFSTDTLPFVTTTGDLYINPDGNNYYIYDMDGYINTYSASTAKKKKFNYRNIMFEVTDIVGTQGAEFYGIDFVTAILGDLGG